MGQTCSICVQPMRIRITLNDLPLRQCEKCHLMRRETFDLPVSYYEKLESGDFGEKRNARYRNSLDRIRLFKKYVPLKSWCYVCTGEGIFLEALANIGGSGVGIEPSESSRLKAKQHGIQIVGKSIEELSKEMLLNVNVVSLFHVIEHLWYFSEKTLRSLVEKSGFSVIASGKRDFDQFNLPIKESLRRLGFLRWDKVEVNKSEKVDDGIHESKLQRKSVFRSVIRYVLSLLVITTGNLQYTWVIAQKNK